MTENDKTSRVGGVPSGSRSEYGGVIPLRPRPAVPPTHCLQGHQLDLGGMTATYHHLYRLDGILCEVCRIVELDDPPQQCRAEWAYIDTSVRYDAATAPAFGLVLLVEPPPRRGGKGHLRLRLDGATVATIDLALCGSCRRGTIHAAHVDKWYRRLGYGRTLVAAALTLQPTFTWTTESHPDTVGSRAFWATTGLPKSRFEDRCPHIVDAPKPPPAER
jgi:hypothetical protein